MHDHWLRQQLEAHHRESFGWAMACCGRDPQRAEDVLQRTYLKVLEGKARYDAGAKFKTWLFAVIRNTARDEKRRELLRHIGLMRYEAHAGAIRNADGDSAGESLDRSHVRAVFVEALAKLPARQRETMQLVFYHDMSLSEAAGVMGVSLGSARTHYDRGKQALRTLLRSRGIE